ncbi:hypothetical protein BDR05DRAFT_1030502 [Suillus weaverae]|nr:hypothetical protein BDR05DRAFT_1030502 [Suillus weaverae]
MPRQTERQEAADEIHNMFFTDIIAEIASQLQEDEDSYDNYADSSSSSEPGSDMDISRDSASSSHSHSSSSSSTSSSDLSMMDSDSDSEESPALAQYIMDIGNLYATRNLHQHVPIPKSSALLDLLLSAYKVSCPEFFRSYFRIYPACFDNLVAILAQDGVFYNNSSNPQMPVDRQLAIALYQFGHYGNAASTWKVALQFGVGFGTAILVTSRVMKACCSEQFRTSALQWPNAETKETAKEWVEENSCPAWRDGWLMVDGTLVPLT